MDLGLYKLKYPFRRLIQVVLPWFSGVSPDAISWSILPVGIVTAAAYYYADVRPVLLIVGVVLIFVRMFLATLDGLVAETYQRGSALGEIVNRLPSEVADVLLLLTLTLSSPERLLPGACALALGWLGTFSGLVGLTAGRRIQSVGPVGQTDRLAALIVFSIAGYLAGVTGHSFDAIKWFLVWCAVGGCLTVVLRLWRCMRAT